MKLLNNHPNNNALILQQSWAIAIKDRFGDAQSLIKKLNPDMQAYCSDKLATLCTDSTIPSLVRICKVYDNNVAETLLNIHITEALITMGEQSINANEVKLIAHTIRSDERLRTLNIAMILNFFKRLKSGQFKIYGTLTSRKILESMQAFYDEAIELQRRFLSEKEQADRETDRLKHQQNAISWAEYAKLHRITTKNPLTQLSK